MGVAQRGRWDAQNHIHLQRRAQTRVSVIGWRQHRHTQTVLTASHSFLSSPSGSSTASCKLPAPSVAFTVACRAMRIRGQSENCSKYFHVFDRGALQERIITLAYLWSW